MLRTKLVEMITFDVVSIANKDNFTNPASVAAEVQRRLVGIEDTQKICERLDVWLERENAGGG